MEFPDQRHMDKLIEALWQRSPTGKAAVMVGAGFSRNAIPIAGGSVEFPTWGDLCAKMNQEIYPESPASPELTKSFLRVASEFEAEFGRPALNELILSEIPDQKLEPSILHEMLLELPWADIFTTNYDTILERTLVQSRAYHVVAKTTDLARDQAPRIVKLHGSFPSDTPFIITEEDFRTYPKDFAPFVNTVQQSLLENAFLLLGFSGDDPNFLEWTGWVRDHLRNAHCPIYLCGLLSLKGPERRLLELKGVTPIDLTPVVHKVSGIDAKHRIAFEWFLHELRSGEPQQPEAWPTIEPFTQTRTSNQLPSAIERSEGLPKKLNLSPGIPISEEDVVNAYKRWNAERARNPGWLVAPTSIRESVWESTKYWVQPALKHIRNWTIGSQILFLDEINWRLETALAPFLMPWLEQFEETVDSVLDDFGGHQSFSAPELGQETLTKNRIGSICYVLVLSFARDARESFQFKKWNRWIKKLQLLQKEGYGGDVSVCYEQVICELWQGKRRSARQLLGQYPTCKTPLEKLQKASLLAELDQSDAARVIIEEALVGIRSALRVNGNSIKLLSVEGWCLYLLLNVTHFSNGEEKEQQRQEFRKRWRELRVYACDPWPIKVDLEEKLNRETPDKKTRQIKTYSFDPCKMNTTDHWIADSISQFLPAFNYVRLFEIAAIPMRTSLYSTTDSALVSATKWLDLSSPGWAPSLLVRAGKVKAFKETAGLTRCNVATMPDAQLREVFNCCRGSLEEIIDGILSGSSVSSGDVAALVALVEITSRLTFRLEHDELKDSFQLCLNLHKKPGLAGHIQLHGICQTWFDRLFFAADDQMLLVWMPELFSIPAFDVAHTSQVPEHARWPDPIEEIPIKRLTRVYQGDFDHDYMKLLIDKKLQLAEVAEGEIQDRMLGRLIRLEIAKILDEAQRERLGKLLWLDGDKQREMPACNRFELYSFLALPHPPQIDVVAKIRNHLIALEPEQMIQVKAEDNQIISNGVRVRFFNRISGATVGLSSDCDQGIAWTSTEATLLGQKFLTWWSNHKKGLIESPGNGLPTKDQFFGRNMLLEPLEDVGEYLAIAVFPFLVEKDDGLVGQCLSAVEEIFEVAVYPTIALVGELHQNPDQAAIVLARLAEEIDSEDERRVIEAIQAISHWNSLSKNVTGFPEVPLCLIEIIVERAAFRVNCGLEMALSLVSQLVKQDDKAIGSKQIVLLISSLDAWEKVTNIEKINFSPELEKTRLPTLRAHIAALTTALLDLVETRGISRDSRELISLKNLFLEDPLPEVRAPFQ